MTREEWSKLTDEKKNIKVARLCGWKKIRREILLYQGICGSIPTKYLLVGHIFHSKEEGYVPDYLRDLNAMHNAEISAFGGSVGNVNSNFFLWSTARRHLAEVCARPDQPCRVGPYWICYATAAQRAEAFALTMDRRKNDKKKMGESIPKPKDY